jgi:hypothetical protein
MYTLFGGISRYKPYIWSGKNADLSLMRSSAIYDGLISVKIADAAAGQEFIMNICTIRPIPVKFRGAFRLMKRNIQRSRGAPDT